jgi:Na+/H+ antiporter NhaD/arsenite permease-like protein
MTDFQINLTIAVFAAVILCIAFDLVDMVVAALLGVSTLIVFGILEGSDLMPIVHTAGGPLSLLFGGMVVARVIGQTGIFERIGDLFLRATGGSGRRLLLLIVVLVAPLCAVLPNATAVILVAPIIVSVCRALKVDIVGPLIITAIVSNAAGMLTLVGDPATFLVGSAIGLSFLDYLRMVSLGGVLAVLAVVPLLPLLLPKIWAARVILPESAHPLPLSDPVSWCCRCSCCCSW